MARSDTSRLLQRIPSIRELLEQPFCRTLVEEHSKEFVLDVVNEQLNELRSDFTQEADVEVFEKRLAGLEQELRRRIAARLTPSLQRVVNATGVVIYTNAGRSPMAISALQQVTQMAGRYTNLEYNLEEGKRGHRDEHIRKRLCRLLKCEDATACNNAAAAVLLILNTLAENRKVIVSRGELVEIGGSFRIPAIMKKAGVILEEVGTTNRTRATDYQTALDPETGLILRVHPSNYRIVGFTQRPQLQELVSISRQSGIPLAHDLGSGYLFRTEHPFLRAETTVQDALEAGVDLVCFSGDKLLGGPQAGIILGRSKLVARIRKNPLMRVCRLDKMTLAALEATLVEYERGTYTEDLPSWQFLGLSKEDIRNRAEELGQQLKGLGLEMEIEPGFSVPGGGTAPEERIPTFLIAISSTRHTVNHLERSLRNHHPPVLARIEGDRLLLDLRTVFADEDGIIADAFKEAIN